MSSASAHTSKVRSRAEGQNTKIVYPTAALRPINLNSIACGLSPVYQFIEYQPYNCCLSLRYYK